MKNLVDIRTMPGFNPAVPNGADSVSQGIVYFGGTVYETSWITNPLYFRFSKQTVCCVEHGAILCVAKNENGKIWRCPTCNEGAFEI